MKLKDNEIIVSDLEGEDVVGELMSMDEEVGMFWVRIEAGQIVTISTKDVIKKNNADNIERVLAKTV